MKPVVKKQNKQKTQASTYNLRRMERKPTEQKPTLTEKMEPKDLEPSNCRARFLIFQNSNFSEMAFSQLQLNDKRKGCNYVITSELRRPYANIP